MHLQLAFARLAYASRAYQDDDDFMARTLKFEIRSEFSRFVRRASEEKAGGRKAERGGEWEEGSIEFFHGMSPVSHPKWRGASTRRHSRHSHIRGRFGVQAVQTVQAEAQLEREGRRTPRSDGWIKDEIHTESCSRLSFGFSVVSLLASAAVVPILSAATALKMTLGTAQKLPASVHGLRPRGAAGPVSCVRGSTLSSASSLRLFIRDVWRDPISWEIDHFVWKLNSRLRIRVRE